MAVTEQLADDGQHFTASLDQMQRSAEDLSLSVKRTVAALGGNATPAALETRKRAVTFETNVAKTRDGLRDVERQFELLQKLADTSALLTSSLDLEYVLKEIIDII